MKCETIGIVLRKRNVSEIARASGSQRETIHRAFLSGETHPNVRTLVAVLTAIGLARKVNFEGQREQMSSELPLEEGIAQYGRHISNVLCSGGQTFCGPRAWFSGRVLRDLIASR
jgi:hypothetical protein